MNTSHLGEINLENHIAVTEREGQQPVHRAVNGSLALDMLPLAMAYVPMQQWNEIYEGEKALERGTIFPELDLPFCGKGAR